MKKSRLNNLKPGLFSPLDVVTIAYLLLSGIYMCFGSWTYQALWPHLAIRVVIIALVIFLALFTSQISNRVLRFVKNLYPLIFLSYLYTETAVMKNIVFDHDLDVYLYQLEQWMFGCQPSMEFSKHLGQAWFREVMNMFYFSYYLLTGLVCIALYLSNPEKSRKPVFTVIFSFYLFYTFFDVFPAIGPQYYIPGASMRDLPVGFFGELMHGIVNNFEKPTGAFPSSHVGLAVIVSLLTFKRHKVLFYVTLPFVIGICFATVYLREHYLLDVIAGMIAAPLLYAASRWTYNRLYRREALEDKEA